MYAWVYAYVNMCESLLCVWRAFLCAYAFMRTIKGYVSTLAPHVVGVCVRTHVCVGVWAYGYTYPKYGLCFYVGSRVILRVFVHAFIYALHVCARVSVCAYVRKWTHEYT